ncbi:hypothetical protein Misp01_65290 [Microtetraspora sp. NBRC 13810]|nr:hypothetical protein Misp01_65290 [Microtetraspora sp. NBRC 13810]
MPEHGIEPPAGGQVERKTQSIKPPFRRTPYRTSPAPGGEAADVSKENEVKSFADACVNRHGRIDIAVNSARS